MGRYAAFLRGVSPTNAKMPELKRAFEKAGFEEVSTLLSSGNVIFSAPPGSGAKLALKAEQAMKKELGSSFQTIVRSVASVEKLLAKNPYRGIELLPGSKRVVSFLFEPPKADLKLPIEKDGARILRREGDVVFSAYVPSPRGPVFMVLIEKAFGKSVTTRTWETLEKVVKAGAKAAK